MKEQSTEQAGNINEIDNKVTDGEVLIINNVVDNLVRPETRQCCYNSDDLMNLVQEGQDDVIIYSGSSVEGVRNNGDIDMMYCRKDFIIGNNDGRVDLTFDMNDCYPGFTRLLFQNGFEKHVDENVTTEFNGKIYLNGKSYTEYAAGFIHGFTTEEKHGPAIMDPSRETEYVVCLHSSSWPFNATFFLEERLYNLCQKLSLDREKIVSFGCHLVPISHPLSQEPDIEYRLSFSVVEKYLVRNWTIRQLRCYFLCKEIVKEYLNGEHLSKGICSYFIKTAIFWITELNPIKFWEQSYLKCTLHILETLSEYLTNKTCPNYFIPENFMMSTFTDTQCEELLVILGKICANIFLFSINGATIKVTIPNFPMMVSIYTTLHSLQENNLLDNILKNIFETNKSEFTNQHCLDYMLYADHRLYLLSTFIFTLQITSKFREKPFPKREDSPLFASFKIYHDRHLAFQMLATSKRMDESFITYLQNVRDDKKNSDRVKRMVKEGEFDKDQNSSEWTEDSCPSKCTEVKSLNEATDNQNPSEWTKNGCPSECTEVKSLSEATDDQKPIEFAGDRCPSESAKVKSNEATEDQSTRGSDEWDKSEIDVIKKYGSKNQTIISLADITMKTDLTKEINDDKNTSTESSALKSRITQKTESNDKKEDLPSDEYCKLLTEKKRYIETAEKTLISSIEISGILNDHGLTGNVYLALFYYITNDYIKALDMLKKAHLSTRSLSAEQMWGFDLPIIIAGTNCLAPPYFQDDEILKGLYEERHLHIVSFDSLVLAVYIRFRITNEMEFLLLLIQMERELEHRLWGPKNLVHRDTIWESYFYIRYKLGILDEESVEYAFLSEKASCTICKQWK